MKRRNGVLHYVVGAMLFGGVVAVAYGVRDHDWSIVAVGAALLGAYNSLRREA